VTEQLNPEWGKGAEEPQDEVQVDVDLDLLDESLRKERVGQRITVRLAGHVIHIQHAKDWSSTAMRAASGGDWDTWAREVIDSDDEFVAWVDADLRNYQVEAVFDECGRQSRMNMGKSGKRSGSPRGSQRR
jgi:hypothetical protein